jgi:hypothetical protein
VPAGASFQTSEDKFDALDAVWQNYQVNKRITMNRAETALFEKNGITKVGTEDVAKKAAEECNYMLFRGARDDSQFQGVTQYNYITDNSASSTTPQRPSLKTEAGIGSGWTVSAGEAQIDIGKLIGNLEMIGGNLATSYFFYPEVLSGYLRMPYVNAASTYSNESILNFILKQGIAGAIPCKNEWLYTAAGATPTKDASDVYLVDFSKIMVGYTVPENIKVQVNPDGSYNNFIDFETEFCPVFKPTKYDDDGYYYKMVSRLTAIDMDA